MYIVVWDILWLNIVYLNVFDLNKWMKSLKVRYCFNNELLLYVNIIYLWYLNNDI